MLSNIGKMVVFDGCEAAGKTTQIELLQTALAKEGIQSIRTREPGGTALGERIRELFLRDPDEISTLAQMHLMSAARAQHVSQLILPALKEGVWVICDRFIDCTRVYQGYVPALYEHKTTSDFNALHVIDQQYAEIENIVMLDPSIVGSDYQFPAYNFIFDLPIEEIDRRLAYRSADHLIAFDKRNSPWHAFVNSCYRERICKDYPNRILLDARPSIPDVHDTIMSHILDTGT